MATPSTQELLTLDAGEFRIRIDNGEFSIAGLISAIIQHVKQQNKDGLRLRAVLYPAPEDVLVEQAKQQDAQHREGRAALGLLHGIPVVLKDCIATAPALGMKTSAGSYALQEAKIAANAPIVERLLAAGAIIIGKSNLSEFCAYKGEGLIDGYSPVGGQTKSPYICGDINLDEGDLSPSSPGGSSTGSAVSVSAGFSLVGIGTENDGSIVQPASRQALFALKPTLGLITAEGCWRVAASRDTPGVMARSVRDVALATEAMLDESTRAKLPEGGYGSFLNASFDGMRIGFVDPALWRFPPDLWVPSDDAKEQHDKAYRSAMKRVEELGAKVVYPVSLPSYKELEVNGEWIPGTVNAFENVQAAQDFFDGYVDAKSKIRSLADVIQYNKDHADQSLPKNAPDQSWLIEAVDKKPSEERYKSALAHMAEIRDKMDVAMTEHELDSVVAPMDSPISSLSTASGYPIATVPLGRYHLKGEPSRPFGVAILARKNREGDLFRFMAAFEANFPPRVIPEQVLASSAVAVKRTGCTIL